jgi:hypothetical protein
MNIVICTDFGSWTLTRKGCPMKCARNFKHVLRRGSFSPDNRKRENLSRIEFLMNLWLNGKLNGNLAGD